MDFSQIIAHLLSGSGGAAIVLGVIKAIQVWERKQGRGNDNAPYKQRFFEDLSEVLKQHTEEVKQINAGMKEFSTVIMAKDENLIPRVFESPVTNAMLKRTHETVGIMNETMQEQTALITQIHQKVAA